MEWMVGKVVLSDQSEIANPTIPPSHDIVINLENEVHIYQIAV